MPVPYGSYHGGGGGNPAIPWGRPLGSSAFHPSQGQSFQSQIPYQEVRCVASTNAGNPCTNDPWKDSDRCYLHTAKLYRDFSRALGAIWTL